MTTTSKTLLAMSAAPLDVEQQARGILQRFLHRHQPEHRLAAVDDAVVVAHRQVVHRPHDHLAVLHHRAVLGGVHAENGALRWVDDRRGQHRAEHAAVADAERAAGQLFDAELAVACLDRSEEHTSELQSPCNLVCRLLLEKKYINNNTTNITCMTCILLGTASRRDTNTSRYFSSFPSSISSCTNSVGNSKSY